MLYTKKLTKKEKQILKQHYKKSKCALVREHAHTIFLSGQGRKVLDITLILISFILLRAIFPSSIYI